jgi:hypothetical protein
MLMSKIKKRKKRERTAAFSSGKPAVCLEIDEAGI